MKNESISLFSNAQERLYFLLLITCVFCFSIVCEYTQYQTFKEDEFVKVNATILNIYPKNEYDVLKLKSQSYDFFTSVPKEHGHIKGSQLNLVIISSKIEFIDFLRGFYTKSMLYENKINTSIDFRLSQKINNQHEETSLKELFNALFLAKPLSQELRDFFANLGVSHLIAISGFHLGVLSFCIYFLLHAGYKPFHQKYCPFRNRRFDILIVTSLLLFCYVVLTGVVPSLLRAFIMFITAFFLLRCNIKILSFETLFVTLLVIIVLYPKYVFSLSLWFSVCGVFYIFLFIQYFKNSSKVIMVLFFNFWIFFAFNPIVHYFFPNTSYEQLISPLLTLIFTLFYPLELLAHFLNYGSFLDKWLSAGLAYKMSIFEVWTPWWFFMVYIVVSLLSIMNKKAFFLLNVLLIGFNLYLFL